MNASVARAIVVVTGASGAGKTATVAALEGDVRIAVLDGQTRPSTVFAAARAANARRPHVVLFDCTSVVREARLRGPRAQPELATAVMDSWAAYLRGQADALGLPIVDTTTLTIAEATDRLEALVRCIADPGEDSSTPRFALRSE